MQVEAEYQEQDGRAVHETVSVADYYLNSTNKFRLDTLIDARVVGSLELPVDIGLRIKLGHVGYPGN